VGEKTYIYRRDDNEELVEVPWSVMIDQRAGYITLPDGVSARRCLHLEADRDGRPGKTPAPERADREYVSDAMGFTEAALPDFEADRVKHGFTGIEFTQDPTEPTFRQVKCRSRKEYQRYMRHRGMFDKSTRSNFRLTQEDFDRATELVGRAGHVA